MLCICKLWSYVKLLDYITREIVHPRIKGSMVEQWPSVSQSPEELASYLAMRLDLFVCNPPRNVLLHHQREAQMSIKMFSMSG